MPPDVVNVVIAGIGGQGVLKASDIVVDAVFAAGHDVTKSEIHGMSQRGGSVHSDVRFGPRVLSPMVSDGEADYLVVLSADQVPVNLHRLRPGGRCIGPDDAAGLAIPNPRMLNVALVGVLSAHLPLGAALWEAALRKNLPAKVIEANLTLFHAARRKALGAVEDSSHA
jgi:indolepyruvate ferredoxin oxidoreductase, beta subunit